MGLQSASDSEKRQLLPERRRINWTLPEPILKLSSSGRTVTTEVVGDVAIHIRNGGRHVLYRLYPGVDLTCPVYLHTREIHEVPVWAHPADVGEVGRRS